MINSLRNKCCFVTEKFVCMLSIGIFSFLSRIINSRSKLEQHSNKKIFFRETSPRAVFYLFVCTEVTLVDNISFKYTTLQFDFCIHYSVLTIKNLVSIRHHIFNLFLSISPFLHLVTTNLLSVSMGLFLFCLFLSFLFYIPHVGESI